MIPKRLGAFRFSRSVDRGNSDGRPDCGLFRLEAIVYAANDPIDIEGREARGVSRSGPRGKSWDRNDGEIDDLRQKPEVIVFDETRPMLVERVFEAGAGSPAVPALLVVDGLAAVPGVAVNVVVLTSASPSCSTAIPPLP